MKKYIISLMLIFSIALVYAQEIVPIAEIQNNLDLYEGEEVTVQAVVTIGDGLLYPSKTKFYVEDESGRGIQVYKNTPLSTTYVRGDKVEITATVNLYDGGGNYHDVQLYNPSVTLISTGNALPSAYEIAGGEDLTLNGSWSRAIGVVTDIWDSDYGFYQIEISVNGVSYDLQFWDSTGADVSEYSEGDLVSTYGVIAFYQGAPQLSCAYESDISIFTGNLDSIVENVSLDVSSEGYINLCFNISAAEGEVENIEVLYNLDYDNKNYPLEITESESTPITYSVSAPVQESGVTVNFNLYVEFADGHIISEQAFESYTFPVTTHEAILKVPAKPFDPVVGTTLPIDFYSKPGDKAILRIYNAEGKLVFTPKNLIIDSADGINRYDWDGRDKNGNLCPIGLYLVHLQVIEATGGKDKTKTVPVVIGTPLK